MYTLLTSEPPLSAVVVVVVEAEVEPPPDGRVFLDSVTKAIENTTQRTSTFGSILDVSKETSKARMSLDLIHILHL